MKNSLIMVITLQKTLEMGRAISSVERNAAVSLGVEEQSEPRSN
jgi:hypothetical protein